MNQHFEVLKKVGFFKDSKEDIQTAYDIINQFPNISELVIKVKSPENRECQWR